MARKDREGWSDDAAAADRSQWRSGSPPSREGSGRSFEDPRATEPWGGSAVNRSFEESHRTTIPGPLRELFGILVVLNGPRRLDIHKIDQRKLTLGRYGTDIVVDDAAVGKQHAVITVSGNEVTDAEFRILDRGQDELPTKSGTRVNDRFITDVILKDRDHIQLGETQLLFVQLWPEALSGAHKDAANV